MHLRNDDDMSNNYDRDNAKDKMPRNQSFMTSMVGTTVVSSMGSYFVSAGKQKAQQAFNVYSHIDFLRPYFDVEPRDVFNRLFQSMMPFHSSGRFLSTELYGPLMIVFTLCAIIIYQMKLINEEVQDGTLIGAAFVLVFLYWLGTSFALSTTSIICSSSMSLSNYLNLIGYSMFSYCVILLVGTFLHTSHDHAIFYSMWGILCGFAGLKMAYVVFIHTPIAKYRFWLALLILSIHMIFILYIHFKYHERAEEISHALIRQHYLESLLVDPRAQRSVNNTILLLKIMAKEKQLHKLH